MWGRLSGIQKTFYLHTHFRFIDKLRPRGNGVYFVNLMTLPGHSLPGRTLLPRDKVGGRHSVRQQQEQQEQAALVIVRHRRLLIQRKRDGEPLPSLLLSMIHFSAYCLQNRVNIAAACALVACPCGERMLSLVPVTMPVALAQSMASSA